MKRSMLAFFLALAFTACQENQRYTQQSAEIEAVKSLFAAYESGVLESQRPFYAENAQIFYNVPESEPSTLDEILAKQAEEMAEFSDFSITFDDDGIEMVVTDKGETWVNFWGEWHGTMKATGQKFVIPIHETLQFVDGKVVKEFGYWDNAPLVRAFMDYQASQQSASDSIPD